MIPVIGFVPDLPETTPGALFDVVGLVPTQKGMKSGPDLSVNSSYTLAAECRGSAMLVDLAGSTKLYAGTQTGLYEQSGGTWTNRTGSANSLAGNRWSFAQFGNDTLAAAITETLQKATTGNFADIAGAPAAEIVLSVNGFVMLLHTNEGTYGDQRDRWWCSAYLDDTDWTPAVSTQCTTGRLVEGDGPITAGAVLGDAVVVAKRNALFIGRYVGPPSVWEFTRLSGSYGAAGPNSIANLGDRLVIASHDDIYMYDGNSIQSIAVGKVKDWYTDYVSNGYASRVTVVFNKATSQVWVSLFTFLSATYSDRALVYNIGSGMWGLYGYTERMEDVTVYPSAASAGYSINEDHVICVLSDGYVDTSFQTWTAGDEDFENHLSKVDLRIASSPTTATVFAKYKQVLGDTFTSGDSVAINDGTFDVRQTARWHAAAVVTTGQVEFSAVRFRTKPEGTR